MDDKRWTYFTDEEVSGLVPEFVAKLDMARKVAGVPFVITSGLRTPEKNQSVIGAVPDSAHLKGLAVDLAVSDSRSLCKMIEGAFSAHIQRIGIYFSAGDSPSPMHLHLDDDPDKDTEVVWLKREFWMNVLTQIGVLWGAVHGFVPAPWNAILPIAGAAIYTICATVRKAVSDIQVAKSSGTTPA